MAYVEGCEVQAVVIERGVVEGHKVLWLSQSDRVGRYWKLQYYTHCSSLSGSVEDVLPIWWKSPGCMLVDEAHRCGACDATYPS